MTSTMPAPRERSRWLYRALPAASVLVVLALWSSVESRTVFLPSLDRVAVAAGELLTQADTYREVAASLQRLVAGLLIGTGLAVVAALATHMKPRLLPALRLYNTILFGLPSLLLALLSLAVVGVNGTGVVVVVVLIVFPFVADPLLQALREIDERQLEMAEVFRFRRRELIRHVILPNVAPYFMSGLRNGHALAWKVLVVAEVFSVRSGLGYQFKQAFDFFRISRVLVWLLLLLAMIGLIEYGILRTIEKRAFAWRPSTT